MEKPPDSNLLLQQAMLQKLMKDGAVPLLGQEQREPGAQSEVPQEVQDQMSLQFRMFPDLTEKVVVFEFSVPVRYAGFTAEQARNIAKQFNILADKVDEAIAKEAKEEEKKEKRNERRRKASAKD